LADPRIQAAIDWGRKNVALGTVGTVLAAVASYVGGFFFRSYYDFYFIDASLIKVPAAEAIASFVVIFVLSAALVALVVRSGPPHALTFSVALQENIPLFVLLFLLGALVIDIYWSNVETMSSWLAGMVHEEAMLERNQRLTPIVTHFLKRALLLGPLAIASVVFIGASLLRFSFARFIMRRGLPLRALFFAMFVMLALSVAGSAGKAVAFLEFTGVLNRPELIITHSDGKRFDAGGPVYLIARTDSVLYVSRKMTEERRVATWLIPQSAVRHIEFRKSESESKRLLDYFK
jgi:hypothetical protein